VPEYPKVIQDAPLNRAKDLTGSGPPRANWSRDNFPRRRNLQMRIQRFAQATQTIAVALFVTAAAANAGTITFNTSATGGAGTGFNGSGILTLNSSSGVAATLGFVPDGDSIVGVPGNVNFGNFTLACATCSTEAIGTGANFSAFTFDMVVTDVTDNATGVFVGTASAGSVFLDDSTITLQWLPLQLGPGTSNATLGSFGPTYFDTTVTTRIVNPDSGAQIGSTTVQGNVDSTPEPATFGLIGGGLLGVALLQRKRFSGR
jgi:hypothetical protein